MKDRYGYWQQHPRHDRRSQVEARAESGLRADFKYMLLE